MKKYRNTKTGEIVELIELTSESIKKIAKRLIDDKSIESISASDKELTWENTHNCGFTAHIGYRVHFHFLNSGPLLNVDKGEAIEKYEELPETETPASHVKHYKNTATGKMVSVIPVNAYTVKEIERLYKKFGYGDSITVRPCGTALLALVDNAIWNIPLDGDNYIHFNQKKFLEFTKYNRYGYYVERDYPIETVTVPNDDSWVEDFVKYAEEKKEDSKRDTIRSILDDFYAGITTCKEAKSAFKKAFKDSEEYRKLLKELFGERMTITQKFIDKRNDKTLQDEVEPASETATKDLADTFERIRKGHDIECAIYGNRVVIRSPLAYKKDPEEDHIQELINHIKNLENNMSKEKDFDHKHNIAVHFNNGADPLKVACSGVNLDVGNGFAIFEIHYKKGEETLKTEHVGFNAAIVEYYTVTPHGQEKDI